MISIYSPFHDIPQETGKVLLRRGQATQFCLGSQGSYMFFLRTQAHSFSR
jgi:hypothetical protein